MVEYNELSKFYDVLPKLGENEVYVLVLVGDTGIRRGILESIMIKQNSFFEFKRKVAMLASKRFVDIPEENLELYIDVNKKSLVKGLEMSCNLLKTKIRKRENLSKFTADIMKCIRAASVSSYRVVKTTDPTYGVDALFGVKAGKYYYFVGDYYKEEESLQKSEIPVPGTVFKGKRVVCL